MSDMSGMLRRVIGERLNKNGQTVEVLECGHESYARIQGTTSPFAKKRRCAWCANQCKHDPAEHYISAADDEWCCSIQGCGWHKPRLLATRWPAS